MKFVVTKELGRLAKWLRILGFDASYYNRDNPSALIIQALREERIILTRNHRLPIRTGVRIKVLESEKIRQQLKELLKELKIRLKSDMMFTRCIICNAGLQAVDKTQVQSRVPEYVFNTQDKFFTCPQCQRVYWEGTHWGNVSAVIAGLADEGR